MQPIERWTFSSMKFIDAPLRIRLEIGRSGRFLSFPAQHQLRTSCSGACYFGYFVIYSFKCSTISKFWIELFRVLAQTFLKIFGPKTQSLFVLVCSTMRVVGDDVCILLSMGSSKRECTIFPPARMHILQWLKIWKFAKSSRACSWTIGCQK